MVEFNNLLDVPMGALNPVSTERTEKLSKKYDSAVLLQQVGRGLHSLDDAVLEDFAYRYLNEISAYRKILAVPYSRIAVRMRENITLVKRAEARRLHENRNSKDKIVKSEAEKFVNKFYRKISHKLNCWAIDWENDLPRGSLGFVEFSEDEFTTLDLAWEYAKFSFPRPENLLDLCRLSFQNLDLKIREFEANGLLELIEIDGQAYIIATEKFLDMMKGE